MKRLIIVGAGEYGQVVKEIAESIGYAEISFIDDNSKMAIDKISNIDKYVSEYKNAIVAIGNAKIREEITKKIESIGFKIPTLIHQKAYVSKSAKLEKGVVVEANAAINANAEIQEGSIIGIGAIVNHNATIGKYCQIDAGALVKAREIIEDFEKIERN